MNDYDRIEKIIRYLDEHRSQQPDLDSLAEHVGLSSFHLHRLFSRWAGITPKAFLKCLNMSYAKSLLSEGESVLDTSLEVGLSGPSRLHDLCVTLESATPGEVKSGGAGWILTAGFAETPFGKCLVALNERGICHLSFVESDDREDGLAAVTANWPNASVSWNNKEVKHVAMEMFWPRKEEKTGRLEPGLRQEPSLKALVRGTEFQVRVWRALIELPPGNLTSYSRLAKAIERPSATRAVASAVARNHLAFLIPCHRVIRETGVVGQYRWGSTRKKAILAWEGCMRGEDR